MNDIHPTKMAAKEGPVSLSILFVLLTVVSLALPETDGRSDSSIPLVSPYALGPFDWSADWRWQYDVQISKEPVLEERAHEASQATAVVLFSKHNQKYLCSLPRQSSVAEQEEEEENDPSLQHDVGELLEPLKKMCFTKTVGWWTYEYCHRRHIRQYHLEGGHMSGVTVNIGVYQNETDWSQFDSTTAKARKHEGLVHQVYYTNGDKCDITGKPRQAVAKVHCSLSGNGLEHVVEPEACVYVLGVSSTQLCMHPLFQSSAGKTREVIQCSPVLNAKQYEQYLEREREGKGEGGGGESWDSEDSVDTSNDRVSSLSGLFSKVLTGDAMQPSDAMSVLLSGSFETLGEMLAGEEEEMEEEEEEVEERHKIPKELKVRLKNLMISESRKKEALHSDTKVTESDSDTKVTEGDSDTRVTEGDSDRKMTEGDSDRKMTEGDSDAQMTEGEGNDWLSEDESDKEVTEDVEDEAQYFDVGGWRVRVTKPRGSHEADEEGEGEEGDNRERLRELQEQVSEELEEKLASMGINADGRVKVKFVMMAQDEEEGEEGEDYVDKVIRSLPDDTTNLVSNHLKDVLSGGKVSQREQQRQAQLEDNYNTVWSGADADGQVEEEEEGGS